MKFSKYLALAIGVVAILLASGWFLRNAIIERISNPLLAQYGLTVTGVSLDALATRDASIGYIELEHVSGMLIAIENLTLPIRKSRSGFKAYTAETITVELPASDDADSPDIAQALSQLLALPSLLPQTRIAVTAISAPPYPEIRNALWQFDGEDQQLTLSVDSTSLTAIIARTDDAVHALELSFADMSGTTAGQSIAAEMLQTAEGITLQGASTLDLSTWMPLAGLLGIDNLNVRSGTANLQFELEIPNDMSGEATLYADVTPTSPVQLVVDIAADESVPVTLESAEAFEFSATVPELQWNLRQAEAMLLLSYDGLQDIRVSLTNQSCRSGLTCTGDIGILMENATLPFASVARLEFLATSNLSIAESGLAMRVSPNATLIMTGISDGDIDLEQFDARLISAATVKVTDGNWQVSADSIDLSIEALTVLDDVSYSSTVFLEKLTADVTDELLSVTIGAYASSGQVNWDGRTFSLPGFSGGIGLQGADLAVVVETDGLYEEATIELSHNIEKKSGSLSLSGAIISFDSQDLAGRIMPQPENWNVSAGTLAVEFQADWQKSATDWRIAGHSSAQMTNLAGAYEDIAFIGLSTSIDAGFEDAAMPDIDSSRITVALLDIGLPIEDITADFVLSPEDLSVGVENLRMHAFDGVISADPFSFSTAGGRNTLRIHAESIDLGKILSMQEFESVEISGKIGAELPVTIDGESMTIVGGSLYGEPPGGIIRYLPGLAADQSDLSGLGVATRALSNFEFETLTADLDYDTDGNLKLQMRLTGRNPDLENNRPVILNLGVENNVPQMLRSLRAARAVEEILERRLAQ